MGEMTEQRRTEAHQLPNSSLAGTRQNFMRKQSKFYPISPSSRILSPSPKVDWDTHHEGIGGDAPWLAEWPLFQLG